jgi:hypothetical protein
VGDPHITPYVNHVARKNNGNRRAQHAIVPDIHALNFPAGKQSINDSGSSREAEAIFEVKTFTACKSRYAHNNTKTAPVDRRAKMIVNSYSRKFKILDVKFSADLVGDGNGDIKGPFETAQQQFLCGQVVPVCAGWFGEINEDFDKTIKILAREAAAGIDGISVSPLVSTNREGGVFPIIPQQFRRAIGVAMVRRNANHKLGRLHYVRGAAEEAAHTCKANHSNYRYKPSQSGGSSWYSNHTPEGYATFQQFQNGYDFCMP